MSEQTTVVAFIFSVSLAGMVGVWYGRSRADDEWQRLLRRADLPPACEARLEAGAKSLNFDAEEQEGAARENAP